MNVHTNDYKFEIVLGKGSFGRVYMVRRRKDCKPFVIKEQDISGPAAVTFEMVLEEVQCLQKMRHPNIVAYYGAWRENNRSYILMEYATRGTLKDLLERRKMPLKEEDALYLFSQVALGVHHIHAKKVLHRDLKPENIMLTGRRGDIVKIGDFGVSKNIQGYKNYWYFRTIDRDRDSITCQAGSYYYMAPEMLKGQPYDFKCDVWSMGVVLYEMITNELPFPATSQSEIIELVCNAKPRPLSNETSDNVVNLISKMLRKGAPYRPRTNQLVLCPYLVPFIIRVYLNLGRSTNVANRDPDSFGPDIFLSFLKPQQINY